MPGNVERTYYVICDDNCRFEGMTKEQIISAIAQATGAIPEAIDVDAAFITKIKETNAGKEIKFWVGTTAQYNALQSKPLNTFYIFTDDPTAEQIKEMAEKINEFISGVQSVENAVNALNAENAASADNADNADNAKNAEKVNNLEIKLDENGVLKIGDVIIPQKKLLWSGRETALPQSPRTLTLSEPVHDGDTIEIWWKTNEFAEKLLKTKCYCYIDSHSHILTVKNDIHAYLWSSTVDDSEFCYLDSIKLEGTTGTNEGVNTIKFRGRVQFDIDHDSSGDEYDQKITRYNYSATIYAIYKIIE